MAVGIRLPDIPESAVPYTVTPDVMTSRAGLGFGGTASTARMAKYRDMLIARGYSPSEAEELAYLEEKQAWRDRATEGAKRKAASQNNVDANLDAAATPIALDPSAGGHMSVPPETPAQKQSRMEGYQRADARMQGFENEYNAVTGHPEYGYDESGNPAKLGKVDIDNPSEAQLRAKGARSYQRRAPYNAEIEARNYGPGSDYVTDTAGVEPDLIDSTVPGPRTLDGRSPTPSRGLNAEEAEAYNTRPANGLSKRDSDMRERGFVPVVTPDGVRYMLAGGKGDSGPIPGGVGRRGARPDLTGEREDDEGNAMPAKYEEVEKVGPDGRTVVVLAPTRKFKKEQADNLRERRKALAAERQARRDRWQATAYLAGGSQNLNSGNRWIANALANMSPEQQEQAMRYMLPGGDRRALVDAQNMENANDVIRRFLTSGAAAGLNNPAQAAAIQQQQLQQQQEMVDWAEKHVNENYAWDADSWFPGSDFTEAERTQTINALMNRYGPPNGTLTLADATRIVDNIGSRKPRPRAAQSGSQPAGAMPTDGWAPPTSM